MPPERRLAQILRNTFGAVVATSLLEGTRVHNGFLVDAKGRLVVIGPEGESIGGGGAEKVKVVAASGASQTINLSEGTVWDITLTANCALTLPTLEKGRSFALELVQDATGSRLATFGSSARWSNGVLPTLSTAAGARDLVYFQCFDGVHWDGFFGGPNMEAGGKSPTISAVVQEALNLKQNESAREAVNGYAGLDGLSRLPVARIQPSLAGNEPTTRLETVPRLYAQAARGVTTKVAAFTYFTPDRTLKVKKLKMAGDGTLAVVSTFTKFGLYTVAEAGELTCVARTKNEASLFEGSVGIKELAILDNGAAAPVEITEYELVRGTRYAFAVLIIATTTPQLLGANLGQGTVAFLTPTLGSQSTENQADLPSSLAANKVSGSASALYGILE